MERGQERQHQGRLYAQLPVHTPHQPLAHFTSDGCLATQHGVVETSNRRAVQLGLFQKLRG